MGSIRDTQIEKLVNSGSGLLEAITKFFEAATEAVTRYSNPASKVKNDSKNLSDRS